MSSELKARQMPKLKGTVIAVNLLKDSERRRMFALMNQYYEQVSWETFSQDLAKKSKVILLTTTGNFIRGFSTLQRLDVEVNGKKIRGMFSGDTVLEREFWGSRVLGKVFLKELFLEKLRHPFQPLFWLLMSKGYKTYLIMANNFRTHYPRFEHATPTELHLIQSAFYSQLYPKNYNPETNLITFADEAMHLKTTVAPISKDLLANRRILYFEKINPRWAYGAELACLAEMTLMMPFYYSFKAFMKSPVMRRLRSSLRFGLKEMQT